MVNFLKSLLELARSYLLRRKSGYSIAAILVLAYLGLQGIKLVSPWLDFELTLLGVDSGFGAVVVTTVAVSLIVAQYCLERRTPILLTEFKEALRLRELGYSEREIEAKSSIESSFSSAIYASISSHSVPVPVRSWTLEKVREVVGATEFSELLVRIAPTLSTPDVAYGSFYQEWLLDTKFRDQFDSIDDVIRWIASASQKGDAGTE